MLQPSRTHAPTLARVPSLRKQMETTTLLATSGDVDSRAVWIRKTVEMNRQTAHEMLKQAFTAAGLNGKLATYSLRKQWRMLSLCPARL